MLISILALCLFLANAQKNYITAPFQEYVNEPEPHYKWEYTGRNFKTLSGGHAYVLNVTSLKWLNETNYKVIGGNSNDSTVWTHETVIVVPKDLLYTNVSTFYFASLQNGCNKDKPIDKINFDIEMADIFAHESHSIGVASF